MIYVLIGIPDSMIIIINEIPKNAMEYKFDARKTKTINAVKRPSLKRGSSRCTGDSAAIYCPNVTSLSTAITSAQNSGEASQASGAVSGQQGGGVNKNTSGSNGAQTSGNAPSAQNGSNGSPSQNGGDKSGSQTDEKSGTDSQKSQNRNTKNSKSDAAQPNTTAPDSPQERDNAEVDYNDL